MLEKLEFMLYEGTNSFGDEFLVIYAPVSPATFAEYRQSSEGGNTPISKAAADLRKAVTKAHTHDEREVRFVALGVADNVVRGTLGDYRYEGEFDRGGFATIHRALAPNGSVVALKKLYAWDAEAMGRFRREIEEQRRIEHPCVMPIVDHDGAFRWFVMPLADESLAARWTKGPIDNPILIRVLRDAADGLGTAHALGLVHRDVTPRNLLRVGEQWLVADWGIVRRPAGMTTMIRTQGELGSNGFAAPELFRDAHKAGPSADVYALGRIAAWAITRKWPEQNVPLFPQGPWRQLVRRTTEHDASRRVRDMREFASLLMDVERHTADAAGGRPPPTILGSLEFEPERIRNSPAAADKCFEACLNSIDDPALYIEHLSMVSRTAIYGWVASRPDDVELAVEAMSRHLMNRTEWKARDPAASIAPMAWLLSVAKYAVELSNEGILEDAATALLRAEARWQQSTSRTATRAWLQELTGKPAQTVARVISREHDSVPWLLEEHWSAKGADVTVRAALRTINRNAGGAPN